MMRNRSISLLLFFTFCFCGCLLLAAAAAPPLMLKLERAFSNHSMQRLSMHKKRHSPKPNHVASFPLRGDSEPFHVGFYYTKVLLGSPPREFHVIIDTGSDVTWVSCASCIGCPKSSQLSIGLNYFDPKSSSTSSVTNYSFEVEYAEGSRTSGRYISDLLHFTGFANGPVATDSSSRVVFGCSDLETGRLAETQNAVDGILGLGNHDISVISQLSSHGVVPKVFSHCLRGDSSAGGTLIFGEVVDPTIVYSPLIPSQ